MVPRIGISQFNRVLQLDCIEPMTLRFLWPSILSLTHTYVSRYSIILRFKRNRILYQAELPRVIKDKLLAKKNF